MITYGPEQIATLDVCPVCGRTYVTVNLRDEPVTTPDTARHLGWWRTIRTFVHADRSEHRVPVGVVFERLP